MSKTSAISSGGFDEGADVHRKSIRKAAWMAAGSLCVGLGAVGIFVPILPTTPFLLLAAACYARSSESRYKWLFTNRLFGEHLRRYRDKEGLPLSLKAATLALLWVTIGISFFWAVPDTAVWERVLLLGVGLSVTIHLSGIKTRRGL